MSISFKPKLTYDKFESIFKDKISPFEHVKERSLFGDTVENDRLYRRINKLVGNLEPEINDFEEKTWFNLYLPIKEGREFCTYPFKIDLLNTSFYSLTFAGGKTFSSDKGKQKINNHFFSLVSDAQKFTNLLKDQGESIIKVPYYLRSGTVQSIHVLDHVINQDEKERLLSKYDLHLKNMGELDEISLNQYLETSAIIRKILDPDLVDVEPLKLIKSSYGGGGSMLEIDDYDSQEEFSIWLKNSNHGYHPFTIKHKGSYLLPPSKQEPYYRFHTLSSDNPSEYVKIIDTLIDHNIIFKEDSIDEKIESARGRSELVVNDYLGVECHGPGNKFFEHVKWDPLKLPKWK
jgi:hypothetical protein